MNAYIGHYPLSKPLLLGGHPFEPPWYIHGSFLNHSQPWLTMLNPLTPGSTMNVFQQRGITNPVHDVLDALGKSAIRCHLRKDVETWSIGGRSNRRIKGEPAMVDKAGNVEIFDNNQQEWGCMGYTKSIWMWVDNKHPKAMAASRQFESDWLDSWDWLTAVEGPKAMPFLTMSSNNNWLQYEHVLKNNRDTTGTASKHQEN